MDGENSRTDHAAAMPCLFPRHVANHSEGESSESCSSCAHVLLLSTSYNCLLDTGFKLYVVSTLDDV